MEEKYWEAFKNYLDTYLTQRDLKGIDRMLDANSTGFGTGPYEVAFGKSDHLADEIYLLELFTQDISDVPTTIDYTVTQQSIKMMGDSAAVVMATVNFVLVGLPQVMTLNGIRMSVVFADSPKGVCIQHAHVSFPTEIHEEGESYPLKELEDSMKVVERILKERTQPLHEAYLALYKMVHTDKLTKVASRVKIDDVLDTELHRFSRYGSPFSLVFFDVDHFKKINNQWGHSIGDEVLRMVAQTAQNHARDTDLVGRWGGDEFLILLPETSLERAEAYAEKILAVLGLMELKKELKITASIGVTLSEQGDTVETLFSRVDQAMYRSKRLGGNRVSVISTSV